MSRLESAAFWNVLASADSETREKVDLARLAKDERLLRACVDLAAANGLAYPFLYDVVEYLVTPPISVRRRWEAQSSLAVRYRETIETLNDTAEDTGISYAVIKNCTAIDHVPRDVDVFLPADDRDAFLASLEERGLRPAYRNEAEISMVATGLLRVDVYSRINYLGRDFVDEGTLRHARSVTSNLGVSHPALSPEATYLVNSAHSLFGHGAITLLDFVDFATLKRRIRDLTGAQSLARMLGWGSVLGLWTARLAELRRMVYERGVPVRFPARHSRRFILDCVAALGWSIDRRDEVALRLSLLWDDLLFVSEQTGLNGVVRESRTLRGLANAAGHRLRILRGDRKGLYVDADKRRWERSQILMR